MVLPPPVTVPVNVPPTRYSREDTAVVSGAIGSWVSSLAATVSTHPSGLVTTAGSLEATTPVSGGGPGSSAGGSATAIGAVVSGTNEQAASAAKRFNMVGVPFEFVGIRRPW